MTRIERIDAMLNTYNFTEDEVAFLTKLRESIAKANARKSTKPTKAQVANVGIKSAIAELLTNADEPMQAKPIGEALGYSVQKVSSLLTQMVKAGEVVKTTEKGKSYFTIA